MAPDTYAGRVTVVNFWYAGCAPCRAEAPDLQALNEEFSDQDVAFLGVNVRDQTATATAFAGQFGISYPSIIDVNSGEMQLAFSGSVAPNAVPTTVVLDRKGRVASRILGRLADQSILRTLVNDTLAEGE
ncbi:TlpA disulfide reductase family protein [Rathayibacter sp. VKM Ac-2759]|uniref:TlpA family protein disulfide reductase n=1 Tax=Rathayibacter sp. VKM Ac-2759 TaxID=2609252 RepID=UPI003297C9CC